MDILSDRERRIFESLQDEKSREVFFARKKYTESCGSKYRAYGELTDCFYDVFEKSGEWHALMGRLKNDKYILYGAGKRARRVLQMLRYYECIDNCAGIWDSNPALHGTVLENIRIAPPRKLR